VCCLILNMSSFWGLTQQKGPWTSTPQDVYNAQSSLYPYGSDDQSNDKITTMIPFTGTDYTNGTITDILPTLPSIVRPNREINSPATIQLKAGKSLKRNIMEEKLKRIGKKDVEDTHILDPSFVLGMPPVRGPIERPRGYLTPSEPTAPAGVVTTNTPMDVDAIDNSKRKIKKKKGKGKAPLLEAPATEETIRAIPTPPPQPVGMTIDEKRINYGKGGKLGDIQLKHVTTRGPHPGEPYPLDRSKRPFDPNNEDDFTSSVKNNPNFVQTFIGKKQKIRGRSMKPKTMEMEVDTIRRKGKR